MKQESRGNWYLLTGLLLGLGLGLLYSWVISPVQYIDTEPVSLAEPYKDEYRKVIALAYQADQDIGRARLRAALIDPENPSRAMAAQAQRLIAANLSSREARALAVLSADLGQQQSPLAAQNSPSAPAAVAEIPSETPAGAELLPTATLDQAQAIQTATAPLPSPTPTITLTPAPTFTPKPTATPPQVQEAPFVLAGKNDLCTQQTVPGLLKIQVSNAKGEAMPGIQVQITWQDKEDVFYTGLAPEISLGYADFQMQPDITYFLQVGETSKKIEVKIPACGGGLETSFSQAQP